MNNLAKASNITSQSPLVLVIGMIIEGYNNLSFLGGIKHHLPDYGLPTVVASFSTIEESHTRLEIMLKKYPSIKIVVLSLRGLNDPNKMINAIKARGKTIIGIAPLRKNASAHLVDFTALKIAGYSEQRPDYINSVAEKARGVLKITTPVKASTNGNTSYSGGGIARPPRNGGDEFVLDDESGGGETDFSTVRRGRGHPRKAELVAIERNIDMSSTPLPAQTKPPGPPPVGKSPIAVPAFLTNPVSDSPRIPKIGSRVRPLLLPRPELVSSHPEPTASPDVPQSKPVRPPKATHPKGKKTMKNRQNITKRVDTTAGIKRLNEEIDQLVKQQAYHLAEAAKIDQVFANLRQIADGKGKEVKTEARGKPSKKMATAKVSRHGKVGKKKAGKKSATHKPRKGPKMVTVGKKDFTMPGGVAWVMEEFIKRPRAILAKTDLLNGSSEDVLVQNLVCIRKILKAGFGKRKADAALVTHLRQGWEFHPEALQ